MSRNHIEPMVGDPKNEVRDVRPTPKKPRSANPRTKMLNVRLSQPMADYLDFIAAEQGTTASSIVRFLLARTIEEFREATAYGYDAVALAE